jgi:GT2 family glycosyltransferase
VTAPLVSVIVVSWNSLRFLPECLASVEAQTHPAVDLVVVDNGSTDGSADFVAAEFPRATLLRNSANLGFCRANNDALKRSNGVFILCLNADAVLEPDYLERALPEFESNPSVGLIAGKVLRFDGSTMDSAGQLLTRARRIRDRGYGEKDTGRYEEPCDVFSACGAVALYRREMVDAISEDGEFFDEAFFSFGEDMDVGWRARRAGWRTRYLSGARARHYRGGSQARSTSLLGRFSQMARRPHQARAHIFKNRYLLILKNDTAGALLKDLPFVLGWEAVQWAWLLLASPGTLPHLWRQRGALTSAWRRRRAASSRGEGT